MKRLIILLSIFIFCGTSGAIAAPEKYQIDKEHTTILFFVNHGGFSDKVGRFTDYDGYFSFDEKNPKLSHVEITFRTAGIETGSSALDKILQEKLWFNTKQYPEAKFKSSQVNITGNNTANVIGWFTLLGKEKSATLNVVFNKAATNPVSKNYIAGFSVDTVINRSDFGMNNLVPMIGENVRIHAEIEGIRQEPE